MNIKHKIVQEHAIEFAQKYDIYFDDDDDFLEVKVDLNDFSGILYMCKVTKTNNVFNAEIIAEIDKFKNTKLEEQFIHDVNCAMMNNELITE